MSIIDIYDYDYVDRPELPRALLWKAGPRAIATNLLAEVCSTATRDPVPQVSFGFAARAAADSDFSPKVRFSGPVAAPDLLPQIATLQPWLANATAELLFEASLATRHHKALLLTRRLGWPRFLVVQLLVAVVPPRVAIRASGARRPSINI